MGKGERKSRFLEHSLGNPVSYIAFLICRCILVDKLGKKLPKECSKDVNFHPFYSNFEAVDGELGNILINYERSVVFRLNFSLVKVLNDQLEDEGHRKNITRSSFR